MLLLELSDDLLRLVVRRIGSYEHRHSLARTCRRCGETVRAECTLWVELVSSLWSGQDVGMSAPSVVDGALSMPLQIDVTVDTLHNFPGRIRWALDLQLLAHRRSASTVGVRSLSLLDRDDLLKVLPGLSFHLAGLAFQLGDRVNPETLSSLTLVHCELPANMGLLLSHVRRLRIWECVVQGVKGRSSQSEAEYEQMLARSLSMLQLDDFVWIGGRHRPPPLALLETARAPHAHALRRLVLAVDHMALDELSDESDGADASSAPNNGGGLRWTAVAGSNLEQLVLASRDTMPAVFGSSLLSALPTWSHSLRVLHMGADALSSLCCREGGAAAFLDCLPPTLEVLGTIDCSWLGPTWFFEAMSSANATAPSPKLSRLTQLTVFVNSPGATASNQQPLGNRTWLSEFNPAEHCTLERWPTASFDNDCALSLIAQNVARIFPSLERLFITWYEEDDVFAASLATALAPLNHMACLRELHLLRSGSNCGHLINYPETGAPLDRKGLEASHEALAAASIASVLPAIAVVVHDVPRQALGTEAPLWELEDAVNMLPEGALCRRLAPLRDKRYVDQFASRLF